MPSDAPNSRWFTVAAWVMLALIALSMAAQVNDPDPVLWMALYGAALVPTVLALAGRHTILSPILAVGYLALAVIYVPGWSVDTVLLLREPKMSSPAVELAREAFGMLLCSVWCGAMAWVWWNRRRPAA